MVAILAATAAVTVPFQDCDPMGVTWHGNYLRYFEEARRALFTQIDYGYQQMQQSGYAWPIIDLKIRYPHPTTVDQQLLVKAELLEWQHRLRIRYQVHDADTGKRLVKGETVQVAVAIANGEMCLQSPAILQQKLAPWLD
ncbi:acyl-CoA thioesterase [Ferrimonas senticii]|uniref:acyl-CoA thioesterase n=1 Tax=Ferrimonas senticii TaxID=394566 RepID=UPI000404B3E1|nr:acyl-CoA thioesterase [Ferrimonas senticii]